MKATEDGSVPCREQARLIEADENGIPWKKWGPYLSERQWGTVREDYSENGNAWNYFTHDQARSRAYRWGEDGIAGISDDKQTLCFALALWNGRDPILKERMFGLSNSEGNHGEDVKEYYFYLENTPTHSYMKYLYKYPQSAYPYSDLVDTNKKRSRFEFEYELLDTGIFDEDRYFDVFIEYAKQSPEDILIQITAANRGPDPAALHLLPTLWFRNTWTFAPGSPKPELKQIKASDGIAAVRGAHADLGEIYLYCDSSVPLLFTENETNNKRIFGSANAGLYVKDGINDYVVLGEEQAVNPGKSGTKVAAHCVLRIDPGQSQTVRLRLTTGVHVADMPNPFSDFQRIFQVRKSEADEFYRVITPERVTGDEALIMRQALSGMLWSKQYFNYDLNAWLSEHGVDPMHANSREIRNSQWYHMINRDVISMPDKWEYPWYAAWDLAFHTIALSTVDPVFAKDQLELLLNELYKHPVGQLPAYEWNFSDVNPPVHAWAAIFLHRMKIALEDKNDLDFLKRCFGRLSANFDWWINQKDRYGKNLFEGGFLGLDNIGVFDRSAPLPTGGYLEQADGTAWIALFCQSMLEISAELAHQNPSYGDVAARYLDQFIWIARAMYMAGSDGMWDEEDGFFYDVLRLPDGSAQRLKVRSMVGLLPLCATTVFEPWMREELPAVMKLLEMRIKEMPELANALFAKSGNHFGVNGRGLISLVDETKLRRVLARVLDEGEFLSPYGLRAVSRYHAENPYVFRVGSQEYVVDYEPAESNTSLFGGNSNWRGPIWIPVNVLVIRALWQFYMYYGNDFLVECPTGSGHLMNLFEVAQEITKRLESIFLRNSSGRRPVYGGMEKFQNDPHWRDYILFHEYFHGDNGAGLGASHQTGWTGVIAKLIELFGKIDAESLLQTGKANVFTARVSKDSDSTVTDRTFIMQSH
jgi:Mannosylglycerate hydrolase MGH1-like glycoside hydrolase domain